MEILRKKVNGATASETIGRIRPDVPTSGGCSVPEGLPKEPSSKVSSSSSPSSSLEPAKESRDDDDDDNEDEDDVDGEKTDVSRSNKNSSLVSDPKGSSLAIESNVNLSGPVTDL